jgi:hypothetical protein
MVMVTREIVKAEIEKVPEERLEELYEVVKDYSRAEKGGDADNSKALGPPGLDRGKVNQKRNGNTLFSKLRNIKIDGPEDFSENLDLYLSGEKSIG